MPLPMYCTDFNAWKNLPEKEFMEKYGNAVLKQYNIPTKEELEQLEEYDEQDEEEEETKPEEVRRCTFSF